MNFSRRSFFHAVAGAGGLAALRAQVAGPSTPPLTFTQEPATKSTVAIVKGEVRRQMVRDALNAIDHQIRPVIQRKKYVIIKVNNVSTERQLAATHADTIWGILDYLQPKYKLPVSIVESSAGDTMQGFQNFGYAKLAADSAARNVSLVDLNAEAKYQVIPLIDYDLHLQPVRLAARLLDPDAYIICAGMLKTHNAVVATLSVKNMVLGAPLHYAPKETPRWNDKRKYHTGIRQTHYNMLLRSETAPVLGCGAAGRLRGHGRQRTQLRHTGPFAYCDRVHRLHCGRPRGGGMHGHQSRMAGLPELLRPVGPGQLRYWQNRRHRRKNRQRAEEVPDARGHRARTSVDGRNEGSSAQARLAKYQETAP
jgi:hypothetical protein